MWRQRSPGRRERRASSLRTLTSSLSSPHRCLACPQTAPLTDYNIGVSVYFLFYLVTDLSAGLLVKRFGSHIVPWSIVTFGIVTLGTTWIKNRADFFAVRVLLGITEGVSVCRATGSAPVRGQRCGV